MREINSPIKIEDLRHGDEILISAYSDFRWLKVLITPHVDKKTGKYKRVKCSSCVETRYLSDDNYYHWDKPILSGACHNKIQYYDLSYRDIWLIKKGDEI